jgi:hypothetical protein
MMIVLNSKGLPSMSDTHVTVSQAARELGVRPGDISTAFYRRELSDEAAPVVGKVRLIPRAYLPVIESVMRRAGKMKRGNLGPAVHVVAK